MTPSSTQRAGERLFGQADFWPEPYEFPAGGAHDQQLPLI